MALMVEHEKLKKEMAFYGNWSLLLIPFSVALAYYIVATIRNKLIVRTEVSIDRSLNKKLYRKVLSIPFSFFETRGQSEILYRMSLLTNIRDLISSGLVNIVLDGGFVVFIAMYLLYVNKITFLSTIFIILFLFGYVRHLNLSVIEKNQEAMIAQKQVLGAEIEVLNSIQLIKAISKERYFIKRFNNRVDNATKLNGQVETLLLKNNMYLDIINMVAPFSILIAGLVIGVFDDNSLGQIITAYIFSGMAISKATGVFQQITNVSIIKTIVLKVNDILDYPDETTNEEGIVINDIKKLSLNNISFCYPGTSVKSLSNVSVKINKGDKIAFVGATGSGKSTLLKIISGLYIPAEGNFLVNDIDISDINLTTYRENLQYVPQNQQLIEGSIRQNLTLGGQFSDSEIDAALTNAQIKDDISKLPLQLDTVISQTTNNLSGGQIQRIMIARAILNHSSLIMLDEATSSLDTLTEKSISNYLSEIGITEIVLAQRLSTIMSADNIFVFDEGKIVECGKHDKLMAIKNGVYRRMFTVGKLV